MKYFEDVTKSNQKLNYKIINTSVVLGNFEKAKNAFRKPFLHVLLQLVSIYLLALIACLCNVMGQNMYVIYLCVRY